MVAESLSYEQNPFQFINGFGIENSPFDPDTVLFIFQGRTLDSSYTYQLTISEPTLLTIDTSIIGAGGIDKGPILANKLYGVYVAWDPIGSYPPTAFISSSYFHPTNPTGYNAVKLIGYVATDGSKNFRASKWTTYGSSGYRNFTYAPNIAILQNGTANTQTDINLISYIPNIAGQIVSFELSFTSSTPGNYLTIYSDTGNFNLYAQAANIPNTSLTNLIITKNIMIAQVISPIISYSVTNAATDSASIYCNGYDFFL